MSHKAITNDVAGWGVYLSSLHAHQIIDPSFAETVLYSIRPILFDSIGPCLYDLDVGIVLAFGSNKKVFSAKASFIIMVLWWKRRLKNYTVLVYC